jgi:GT2 family glycosyltransferase
MPELSVVVCTFNREALLRECLASIFRTADMQSTEVIVVENGSTDGTVEMVRTDFPTVRLIVLPTSVGYCVANNVGAAAATAPYLMLLNDDAVLIGNAADGLVRHLERRPDVKCLGPLVLLASGAPQPRVFGNLPSLWRIAAQSLYLGMLLPGFVAFEGVDGRRVGPAGAVGWISGVCMVTRRADFLSVGGFDESFYMYCEDIDLCWKLTQHGGRVVRDEKFSVLHYGGGQAASVTAQIRNSLLQQRNLLKIVRRFSGPASARAAALLIFVGLAPRLLVGLCVSPRRGVAGNALLQTSFVRLKDLLRIEPPRRLFRYLG